MILDIEYVKELIDNGADVHATDDIGQNLMHEIARCHTDEVAQFFLKYDININLGKMFVYILLTKIAATQN